jgi:hypothetical protein
LLSTSALEAADDKPDLLTRSQLLSSRITFAKSLYNPSLHLLCFKYIYVNYKGPQLLSAVLQPGTAAQQQQLRDNTMTAANSVAEVYHSIKAVLDIFKVNAPDTADVPSKQVLVQAAEQIKTDAAKSETHATVTAHDAVHAPFFAFAFGFVGSSIVGLLLWCAASQQSMGSAA